MAHPSRLDWADVDPRSHKIDADVAAITALAMPGVPARDGKREGWEPSVTERFVARYGAWAIGWCWSLGEGTIGGGPVSAWCCAPHSYTTQAETARRCAEGLLDWRGWIETLATTFPELGDDLSRASSSLVMLVAEKTEASDAWYGHCEQVLSWFLEQRGATSDAARTAARQALKGHFESWVGPNAEDLTEIAERFGHMGKRALRRRKK